MTSVRRLPYRKPSSDRINIGEWMRVENDDDMVPIGIVLPDWDPAVDIRASAYCEVDVAGIFEDCYLAEDARLRLATVWFSPGTVLRGKGSTVDLALGRESIQGFDLNILAEGINLAKSVEIITQLILSQPSKDHSPFSPKLPGSLLFEEKHTITLEGDGARFPTEVVDFTQTTYFQPQAGWILHWNPDDLHQTVLGDIRLYINARHERVKRAVSEKRDEDFDIREAIRIDTARTLLNGALNNQQFMGNPKGYPDGTIGAAIRRMITLYFPGESLSDLKAKLDQNSLDHYIQDRLRAFWKE